MGKALAALTGRTSVPDLVAAGVVGVGISLSLSALMLVAKMMHIGALPAPLGVAFAAHLFGSATLAKSTLLPLGLLLHVGYVSTATVIAAVVFRRRLGAVAAFGTALGLWVLAGVSIVPYVGWGLFGFGLGVGAAVNLLATHLLYGAFLWAGLWVAFRRPTASPVPGRSPVTGSQVRVSR
jgi:hypothetical protein